MQKTTFVTQPFLPPLEEFIPYLEKIWESRRVTNAGPTVKELEKQLAAYLGVKYVTLFANGTLALITALQYLRVTGEVITTPYSFVATTHSLWWNNAKPVFVDIREDDCNLDPEKIEAAITPKTTAILPVHVYGNPCDVHRINEIADTYNLKVVYDAAHAFGVRFTNNENLLDFGDISILSFHGTKLFHTFEGGAIISHTEKSKSRVIYLKNFGFENETSVVSPGMNAKMNEVQAAMGLLQLKYIDNNIKRRKEIVIKYIDGLKNIEGIRFFNYRSDVEYNYSYFPIFIDAKAYGKTRNELYYYLKENHIFSRRYFYPLISNFSTYKALESARPSNLPIASMVSQQVLCLPLYPELEEEIIERIIELISSKF